MGKAAGMKIKQMIDENIITKEQAKVGYVAKISAAGSNIGIYIILSRCQVSSTGSCHDSEVHKYLVELFYGKTGGKKSWLMRIVLLYHNIQIRSDRRLYVKMLRGIYRYINVGYNQSMTDIAPTRSLVSRCVDYSSYFEQSVYALLCMIKKIEECIDGRTYKQDAMAGIDKGWVRILDINEAIVPKGTKEMVEDTIEKIERENWKCFQVLFTGVSVFDRNDKINL